MRYIRDSAPRRFAIAASLGAAVAGLILAALAFDLRATARTLDADRDSLSEGQAIFALGNRVEAGRPGPIYEDRLKAALVLWKRFGRPIWLLSDGRPQLPLSAALVGRRYLVDAGVPSGDIVVVDDFPEFTNSLDTTEEIRIAAALAGRRGLTTLLVVGDLWHLAQARLVFDSYGVRTRLVSASEARYGLSYKIKRFVALTITLFDRRGRSLFWLRWIHRHSGLLT